jgi:hypothetical protein
MPLSTPSALGKTCAGNDRRRQFHYRAAAFAVLSQDSECREIRGCPCVVWATSSTIDAPGKLFPDAFNLVHQGNPLLSGRGQMMAQVAGDPDEEPDSRLAAAEDEAFWAAARQAIHERRVSISAPEATAVRLDEAARSHDRIATMYEEIAGRTSSPDECRANASRHRAWAKDDRGRAEQLRHMAEGDAAIDGLKPAE